MKVLLLYSVFTGFFSLCKLSKSKSISTKEIEIVTHDITNFWLAYEAGFGKEKSVQEKIFDSIYIKNASPCLKQIIINKNFTAAHFVKWVNYEADYFKKCKAVTDKIPEYNEVVKEYCEKFKTLYSKADIGDIYFMFTGFYTGGQPNKAGIAIGMDFWSLPDTGVIDFKSEINKELVRKIEMIPITVIHEQVHRNQTINTNNDLLASCLSEGGADFIAYLVTEKINNKALYNFGNTHEKILKQRFIKDMPANDKSYWLYNGFDSSRPRDLGYWMGFKICESYYSNAADKTKAINDILHIKKPQTSLTKSGYLNGK